MRALQILSDKTAIGLSFLCTLHCLALPLLLVVLPSLAAMPFADEVFHLWMLALVIPISIFALTSGYRRHQSRDLLILGGAGLLIMILAAVFGHDIVGEAGEKWGTVIGAVMLAWGHFKNYRLCQHMDNCECHEGENLA